MRDWVEALQRIRALIRVLLRMQRVTIATVGPLTVTMQDGSTVPATAVTGLTYTAGLPAVALYTERSTPLVFPVS